MPIAVAYGTRTPEGGRRVIGDVINLHAPRTDEVLTGGDREVELVVNGRVVAHATVPADGKPHDLTFDVPVQVLEACFRCCIEPLPCLSPFLVKT